MLDQILEQFKQGQLHSQLHSQLPAFLKQDNPAVTVLLVLGLSYVLFFSASIFQPKSFRFGLPFMKWAPRWLAGTWYASSGLETITRAYEAARDKAWYLVRHDVNVIMLPPSAIEEVSAMPMNIASNLQALEYDLAKGPAGLHMLPDAHLHARYVQRKITPNLKRFTAGIQEEVAAGIVDHFPTAEDGWTEIDPQDLLIKISARMSSRVNLGKEWSRDPRWTNTVLGYVKNVLGGVAFVRFFPTWTYPIFKWTLPSFWASRYYFRQTKKLLGPAFTDIIRQYKDGTLKTTDVDDESNGLTWLAQIAHEEERNPDVCIDASILLVLASVPTTVFSEVNILLDMVSNPFLMDEVREEIQEAWKEQGDWDFSTYSNLHKLDSILRESQRMSPPTLIGLRRVMRTDYTLKNGIQLHKGDYIAVPSYSIQNDEEVTENHLTYDGLRSYRMKVKDGEKNGVQHQFTTSEPKVLGWGFGRTACPGRWFASLVLKVIVAKILLEYDMKFPNGETERPKNLVAHEFLAVPPTTRLLVKKRKEANAPF